MSPISNNYPWKTIIFALTIIAVTLSPVGSEIYKDCKSYFKEQHKDQQKEQKISQKISLLEKFSEVTTSKDIYLASLSNQKVKISYKATDIDQISIVFNIYPYTSHRADGGLITIRLIDSDNFSFYNFDIPDNQITKVIDRDGNTVAGRYETQLSIDLTKLEKLSSIEAQTSLSKNRISQLSGQFDNDRRIATQIEQARLKAYKTKLDKDRRIATQKKQDRLKAYKNRFLPKNLYIYKIKSGDTVYQIARRHGIKQSDLLRINEGLSPRGVKVGESILLPKQSKSGRPRIITPATDHTDP